MICVNIIGKGVSIVISFSHSCWRDHRSPGCLLVWGGGLGGVGGGVITFLLLRWPGFFFSYFYVTLARCRIILHATRHATLARCRIILHATRHATLARCRIILHATRHATLARCLIILHATRHATLPRKLEHKSLTESGRH